MMMAPNRFRLLIPCLLLAAAPALAQDAAPQDQAPAAAAAHEGDAATQAAPADHPTDYKDYAVKAYRIEVFGGSFSGGTYLDLPPIGNRTLITEGGDPLYAYNPDGSGLLVSGIRVDDEGSIVYPHIDNNFPDRAYFNAPRKEIKSGPVYGGRIGIYIADRFHLDLVGVYASGDAVTTMLYDPDGEAGTEYEPTRVTIEKDTGFKVYMGGLDAMYDAVPATFLGLTPHLGFGLGGIINRYTYLEDKTGLYLKGNFGLSRHIGRNVDLYARAEVSTFAFDVDELGYSNMVSYANFTLGLNWFLDVLPSDVRAKHEAALAEKR